METPEQATVQRLRSDMALQVARHLARLGLSQAAAARSLDIPQPTLSKIVNGRVANVSLEFLVRVAVRAGLPVVLQTGGAPEEAGAFVSAAPPRADRAARSRLAQEARASVARSARLLTPSQRAEAFLEHNQLLGALRSAAEAVRDARPARPER